MAVHMPTLLNKDNPHLHLTCRWRSQPLYSRILLRLKRDIFHPILSPYKSYTYLPTTLECLRTLATMLYKLYHTFWMNLEYYKPIITMDVLTEILTLKLKLTLYFLTLWCQILERTTYFCINVFHMTCLVLKYQISKRNTYIYCTPWRKIQT